jgi:hypothetical protein
VLPSGYLAFNLNLLVVCYFNACLTMNRFAQKSQVITITNVTHHSPESCPGASVGSVTQRAANFPIFYTALELPSTKNEVHIHVIIIE